MVLALVRLRSDLTSAQDQIVTRFEVSTSEDVSARLLHLSSTLNNVTNTV